ncbi:eukaryotic translation initiation factor 5 (EIF5) [Vairimorpha necatrix]|uniref:Eukaryotic translation initiation factor 5 (EIF5) n=1 Tax=Vairimorpha necatrix TaxID=6039 RepID=A0AAX4JBF1_9MICR
MIPINKNIQDIHFRYKMPSLIIKYEGKNTGVKTILVNLDDISRSLSRKSDIILKYFSYTLSLQTKHDGKFIISGKHDQMKMQNIIYDFIDHFVLCYNCENPETFFVFDTSLKMECLACGLKSIVRDHKLNLEIIKNISTQSTIYSDFLPVETGDVNNEEMFYKLLKESEDDFNKLDHVIEKINIKNILGSFENYIEKYKKYENITKFINYLLEKGYKKSEICKFYTRPQNGKKRSVEFKKEINKYFNS